MDCQFVFLLNFIYQSINGMCWIDKSISSSLTFTYIPFTKTPKKMLAEDGGGTGMHLCLFLNTFIHSFSVMLSFATFLLSSPERSIDTIEIQQLRAGGRVELNIFSGLTLTQQVRGVGDQVRARRNAYDGCVCVCVLATGLVFRLACKEEAAPSLASSWPSRK